MKQLVPSSSGISTPSAAMNVQRSIAGCFTPVLSIYSIPLQSKAKHAAYSVPKLLVNTLEKCVENNELSGCISNQHQAAGLPARHQGLALLSIRDSLVLNTAHAQHLRHQAVELIKAAPAATCSCMHTAGANSTNSGVSRPPPAPCPAAHERHVTCTLVHHKHGKQDHQGLHHAPAAQLCSQRPLKMSPMVR